MKRPQLSARDVENGLRRQGFEEQPGTGTSHVKFIKIHNREKLVVTVDAHLEPFSNDLISSMASQARMTKTQFYRMCSKDGMKDAKRGLFAWFFGKSAPNSSIAADSADAE